jgi:hypothetical protein
MSATREFRRVVAGAARAAAATVLAAAMLMAVASAAQAEEIVLSETMVTGSTGHIEVSGDVPAGATHVAVAQCNLDDAVDPEDFGRRCNYDTSPTNTTLMLASSFVTSGTELDVWDMYVDYDFVVRAWPTPATETECGDTAGDEDCAIVVSYYSFVPNPPGPPIVTQLGAEAEEITFE